MNARTKNLAVVGGAAALVGIVGLNLLVSPPPAVSPPASAALAGQGAGASPTATPTGLPAATRAPATTAPGPASGAEVTERGPERRSYAIALQEIAGLPPDTGAGTPIELWVTWDRPITREPRLEPLVGDAVLERLIPGSVPEAPVTVLVSVPGERIGDLIYADAYGSLSASLPR